MLFVSQAALYTDLKSIGRGLSKPTNAGLGPLQVPPHRITLAFRRYNITFIFVKSPSSNCELITILSTYVIDNGPNIQRIKLKGN